MPDRITTDIELTKWLQALMLASNRALSINIQGATVLLLHRIQHSITEIWHEELCTLLRIKDEHRRLACHLLYRGLEYGLPVRDTDGPKPSRIDPIYPQTCRALSMAGIGMSLAEIGDELEVKPAKARELCESGRRCAGAETIPHAFYRFYMMGMLDSEILGRDGVTFNDD